jgi:hypothetical protein
VDKKINFISIPSGVLFILLKEEIALVRAKFLYFEKGETCHQPCQKTAKIILQPVAGITEENKSFWKWTPSGKIELNVVNTEASVRSR